MIESSQDIGRLKLERYVKHGMIVKPKLYSVDDVYKYKGVSCRNTPPGDIFTAILKGLPVRQWNFRKFKSAVRSGGLTSINQVVDFMKSVSLEDDKRQWPSTFCSTELQRSSPLSVDLYDVEWRKSQEDRIKAESKVLGHMEEYIQELINGDRFDNAMVGHDITAREFVEDEIHAILHDE